jgi:hypothetical protein
VIGTRLRHVAGNVPHALRAPELHARLATCAQVLGDLEAAVEELQTRDPGSPITIEGVGMVLAEAADLAEWAGDVAGYEEVASLLLGVVAGLGARVLRDVPEEEVARGG